MLNWWRLAIETSQMAIEAQEVVSLRLAKIGRGDAAASREAQEMFAEKTMAMTEAWFAAAKAVANHSDPQTVAAAFLKPYSSRVHANKRRLSK